MYENDGTITKPKQGKLIGTFLDDKRLAPYRADTKNYFVTVMGSVYKNDKDYAFKRAQESNTKVRDFYKYTGQRIDSELLVEIDRLITEKEAEKK